MKNILEIKNNLLKYNLKATPQRLCIANCLDIHGHMNVDELYFLVSQEFPTISVATIYKNIKIMLERVFIKEVKIPKQKSVYELNKAQHSHIVCSKCNKIVDIQLQTEELLRSASQISNFTLNESAIVLNGVCPECSK
ncbi:MAG: transcriptional repressor [Helicobacteraceae bacterium]|nr:transcriptional repressor [Helicobacteraceae bacterium]